MKGFSVVKCADGGISCIHGGISCIETYLHAGMFT